MVAMQKNFQLFTYVDDDGTSWNKRGEDNAVLNAVNGSSAFGANPVWEDSGRRRARSITYRDATTFRTRKVIFYTAAAFAAIAVGTDTLALMVEGNVGAATYTAYKKNAEKSPSVGSARQLADHA
jgi:hypothetical protein